MSQRQNPALASGPQAIKAMLDNFNEFVLLHPALVGLAPKATSAKGSIALLYEVAIRLVEEVVVTDR